MEKHPGLEPAMDELLRDSENTNLPSRIPSSGHLWLRLNRKILNVALLRLRFCSIGAAKSNPNPGAIQVY
jgi:hypothetical protein